MSLIEAKKIYIREAERIPNVWELSKTKLANIYCDADEANPKDEYLKSASFAALMVTYWGKILKWKFDSASLKLQEDDFVGWLAHALAVAFYYKEWRYENKAVVKKGDFIEWKHDDEGNLIANPLYYMTDDNAVDKIINRCCFSIRGREYQFMNHDKRKGNVLFDSLDAMIEVDDDCAVAYVGVYEDADMNSGADVLVKSLLKTNKQFEALIIEYVAHSDVFTEKKDDPAAFDLRKLVANIRGVEEDDLAYFFNKYAVEESPEELYEKIKATPNHKIYKLIEKTFAIVRNDPKLLCCLK